MNKSLILTALCSSTLLFSGNVLAQKKNIQRVVENTEIISTIESNDSNESKNALFIEGHTYHINDEQQLPLLDKDINHVLTSTNKALSLTLTSKNKNIPLDYFNFKNLPGIDGQIHALWLRNDFSESSNRTFDIQGQSINHLKIAIPTQFQEQSSKQCDVIFISYQLKHTDSPTNIIRYSKIERGDGENIKLYTSKPEGCEFKQLDESNSSFYTKSGYVVNFGLNPKTMNNTNFLEFVLHASKAGKEHFLDSVETVLIKSDFSGINFLKSEDPKFKKSAISPYYGSNYSAMVHQSGSYILGVGFGQGAEREWLFSPITVK